MEHTHSKYRYSLTEENFVQHQLYIASTSEYIKKKRKRAWIILTVAFFALSVFYFGMENKTLGGFFALSGLIYLFVYPSIQRGYYKRHYRRHIQNNYQNRIGEEVEVSFSEGYLHANSKVSEGKIKTAEIIGVSEISDLLFVHISTGENLIIPKRMNGYAQFKEELRVITANQKVTWTTLPDWEFR